MATIEQVSFVDDWDQKPIEIEDINQVSFMVEGVEYKLDLRTTNYERFQKDMNKWTERAQRVGGRKRKRSAVTNIHDKQELARIRTWARENGYEVSDRGRIAQAVQDAFEAANA